MRRILLVGLLVLCGIIALITRSFVYVKVYPVIVNAFFLVLFGHTLFIGTNIIFKFATLKDKSILHSQYRKRIEAYCRKVTLVWCIFFIVNGGIALWTVFSVPSKIWILYNGCLAYILMGILFLGEFIVRKYVQNSMKEALIPLTQVKLDSRDMNSIVCFQGRFADGIYKTWKDFAQDCTKMRHFLATRKEGKWILNCEDSYYFYVTFAALLFSKKDILLTANITPEFLKEIWQDEIGFLTDQKVEGSVDIPGIVDGPAVGIDEYPDIDGTETKIYLYTSGSTGKPKAVFHSMKELESDNNFILTKWTAEIWKRKVCSCVNLQHIYGLLYAVMLPFTAGIPFRRNRVILPSEFNELTDDSYIIIAVPAFLKRAIEEDYGGFDLKSPMIITSGGVLTPDVAKKTDEMMGFWPIEIYGSTETAGIAYRQSKNGLEWTPYEDAEISTDEDGCLKVKSPSISNPEGFKVADLVEIFEDGRFILKGRSDSIVKIEEKRISVTEVENRLNQSPYVKDSCVIAMSDRRQYLAAAVVLSPAGVEKFAGVEKYQMNQFFRNYLAGYFEAVVLPRKWRFVEEIPQNELGKRKKNDIKALFEKTIEGIHGIDFKLREQDADKVAVEFAVNEDCDFFDGHFPVQKFLPAVAQFHIVVRLAEQLLKVNIPLVETKRIKFSSPILPGKNVILTIKRDSDKISFDYRDADGKEFSKGTVFAKESL